MREQFTFYRSYWEAVKRLRKASDRLSALEAIAAYALDEEELERTDAADAIFVLIRPLLDAAAKKSKGGKTSGRVEEDADKISASTNEDTGNNIKNKKKNNIKNKNKCSYVSDARAHFVPPAYEEAQAYYIEKGFTFGLDKWFAKYESNGWKVGRDKMKDWKASMRYWQTLEGPKEGAKSFADMWREMPDE